MHKIILIQDRIPKLVAARLSYYAGIPTGIVNI
jgi:hypothetical protein